jgi:hypothetical protein
MALFKLLLKGFEFPANLPASRANFRFVYELRHFDAANETWVTTESVSPGLTAYWECDPSKAQSGGSEARYVRDGNNPRFGPISPWDQVVLLVHSSELFQMRIVVYDVNRADWVDRLRQLGEGLLGALVGAAGNLPIPSQLAAPVGTLLERVREAVVDRLAKQDTLLFSVVYEFGTDQSSQPIDLTHLGYTMRLALVTTGQVAPAARAVAAGEPPPRAKGQIDASTAFARVPGPAPAARSMTARTSKKRTTQSKRKQR